MGPTCHCHLTFSKVEPFGLFENVHAANSKHFAKFIIFVQVKAKPGSCRIGGPKSKVVQCESKHFML